MTVSKFYYKIIIRDNLNLTSYAKETKFTFNVKKTSFFGKSVA